MSQNNYNSKYFTSQIKSKIYVYTTPVNKTYGYLKIGYTTRDNVCDRIEEQVSNILMPNKESTYEVLLEEVAEYNFKSGYFFTDKEIHKQLKKKGFNPIKVDGQESEWFKCSIHDVNEAIFEIKNNISNSKGRTVNYPPRPEQKFAIDVTTEYFKNHSIDKVGKAPHFLWNAKMRFGKTFTSYKLAEKMQWKKILILTFKPAVQSAWENDLKEHTDFNGWIFKNPTDIKNLNLTTEELNGNNPIVCFSSFQDILGDEGKKEKFKLFYETTWDCVILDEYHFGSWRESAKELYDSSELDDDEKEIAIMDDFEQDTALKVNNYLYLSGTPFRSLSTGEFTENQIFNWTYSDEQKAKESWIDGFGDNPYSELPQIIMMTYKIPSSLRESIENGETEEFEEFDLNDFFKADGKENDAKFQHEDSVFKWLEMITGKNLKFETDKLKERNKTRPPLPFEDSKLINYLNHTIWFMPNVSSCFAMKNLIKNSGLFKNYNVVVAAGNKAGMGAKAIEPVYNAIYGENLDKNPQDTKSITLTCGKLTTGVSVSPWTGIFMLRNLTSPESYFQAAFRVQTPWSIKNPINNNKEILKEKCYIFDFAPNRALKLIADYCSSLDYESQLDPVTKVEEFLNFLPVLAFDGFEMQSLDAKQLLDFVVSGISSTMLAKKFQSPLLINLNNAAIESLLQNQNLMNDLSKIEAFRKLNETGSLEQIISSEKTLKEKKKRDEPLNKKDKAEKKESDSAKKRLRELLLKFITRLPVFMYLTDDREKSVKELIEQIETDLFVKTTGISLETFEELCKINIFNVQSLNAAIFSFKQYEDSSLNYLGEDKELPQIVAGWDSTFTREDAEEIIKSHSNF